ncbi:MAG: ATP-binding protein, partial [Gammaproteobacteria bacterium]|nr:ATP-binding protein [Gammaproteobacteria bacterium]
LGDLAHALKKPLTVLRQFERETVLKDNPDLQKNLATQINSMQKIIDHVLKRARLAGESHAGILFNLKNDFPELIDVLKKMYHNKNIQFEIDVDENVIVPAEREDMLELLGNLLDNACKWSERLIKISIYDNQMLMIIVEDDGRGIEQERINELTQRGKRLDESIEGHGIGLSIVQDIVSQYHGNIVYQRSESLGGLQVAVSLPH